MVATRSRVALGTVTEGAEVVVIKRVGSKGSDMGALHLAIYTRGAAHGTVIIRARERISLPVAINKTAESITPWLVKALPKRYEISFFLSNLVKETA
jgi:hypothetical protein